MGASLGLAISAKIGFRYIVGVCDNMVIFTLIYLILHRNHVCQVVKAWLSLFTQIYTYIVMIDLAFD